MDLDALRAENAELRRRLDEAEETLRAIHEGAVDAFIVQESAGNRVYTLEGADRPYRLLVEQMQQGAATLNSDDTIAYCNLSLARLFRVPHERLIGASLSSFIPVSEQSSYEVLLREGLARASQGEISVRQSDGTITPAYFTFNSLTADCGAAVGVLVTDLTDQKVQTELAAAFEALRQRSVQNEALLTDLRRANADLEQFAYSASHDLQEPIRNVAVYSELFQKRYAGKLDSQAEQFLRFMVEGAHRMGYLVSVLLAYTQAARLDDEAPNSVDAAAVLEQVLDSLKRSIEESGAVVTHDSLPVVTVRETHLQQVLQNLIGNAIKYRKESELPRIHVAAVKENGHWCFSISDNGIGIAPEYHTQVFGLFKRLHGRNGTYGGTGIGLAICQKIVERYGGRIWLEAEPGMGAVFYFTLPQKVCM
jgi:signal transduction histidine kinase